MAALIYLCSFVGLAASSVLLVDYTSGSAVFCGAGGGCDVVRASKYAELFGVHTPWFGVLFFAVALILTLLPARRLLVAWSAAGALAALGFLGVQLLVLRAFCVYCTVADLSAILLFASVLAGRRKLAAGRPALALAAIAAAAGVLAGPFLVARTRPQPTPPPPVAEASLPEGILREQRPGVVTIVEFVDFECPFCRRLHRTIEELLHDYGDKLRVVRKQQPLASLHPHAVTAAHAACCADEASAAAGDKMAAALYEAPPEQLTAEGCERLAARVGLDVEAWKECMASDRPAKQVAADQEIAAAAGIQNEAPVFFVGTQKFRGAEPKHVIRAAIERELSRR